MEKEKENLIKELEGTNSNINNVYRLYLVELEKLKNNQTTSQVYDSKLKTFITQEIKKYFKNSEDLKRELEQKVLEQFHEQWKVAAGGPPPPPPPPPGGMGVQNEDKNTLLRLILKIKENDNHIYDIIIKESDKVLNTISNFTKKYLKYKQKYLELKKNF